MEKKTIGSFIAALRRANGMTQRELAERLNVSDKAVSRWERDESAPDLTLIPVIAEIFGVTADELLRGERAEAGAVPDKPSAKGEKQLDHLLKSTRTKLCIRSLIAVGLCVVGLLVGFIMLFLCYHYTRFYDEYGMTRVIAFWTACVFYVAAAICEAIFTVQAFSTVSGNAFDGAAVNECKRALFATAGKIFGCILTFLVAVISFPIADNLWSAYVGIVPCGVVGALLAVLLYHIAKAIAVRCGVFELTETDRARRAWKLRCVRVFAAILLVTGIGHAVFVTLTSASTFATATVFSDVESFVAYMETYAAQAEGVYNGIGYVNLSEARSDGSQPSYEREYVYNADGEAVFSYLPHNQDVVQIEYGDGADLLPITVYTSSALREGYLLRNRFHMGFMAGYLLEIAVGFAVYFARRKRMETRA